MRKAAFWLGLVLAVIGIAGFIPGITTSSHHLIGLFAVDTASNIVRIVLGAIAMFASSDTVASRRVLKTLAVIFAVWTIVGLFTGDGDVIGMANNYWTVAMHAVVTIFAAAMGWSEERVRMSRPSTATAFGEYADRDETDRRI